MFTPKTVKVRSDWQKLIKETHASSRTIAWMIWESAKLSQYRLGKRMVITHILRSQAKQAEIYGKGTKKKSPHQFGIAFDVSKRNYSKAEQQYLLAYFRQYDKWNRMNTPGLGRTAFIHRVGSGADHFHVQYDGPLRVCSWQKFPTFKKTVGV